MKKLSSFFYISLSFFVGYSFELPKLGNGGGLLDFLFGSGSNIYVFYNQTKIIKTLDLLDVFIKVKFINLMKKINNGANRLG